LATPTGEAWKPRKMLDTVISHPTQL
jgi:hypothetical protein